MCPGVHVVTVLAIEHLRIHVRNLEIDGTPIVDIEPVLEARGER